MLRSVRLFTCVVAVMAAVVGVGPASAQVELSYTIDPTSGGVGSVISFSGEGCPTNGLGPDGADAIFVFASLPEGNFSGQTQALIQSEADGSFAGTIVVPDEATVGTTYDTGISCFGTGGGDQGWPENLGYQTFTVTGSAEAPPPPPPPAPGAAPVQAAPRFTG